MFQQVNPTAGRVPQRAIQLSSAETGSLYTAMHSDSSRTVQCIERADEKEIRTNVDGSCHYARRCNFSAIRREDLETTKIYSDDTQFPLTKYYLGDQTKKNERDGGMWHLWGETRGAYRVLVGKSEGKRQF